MSVEDLEEEALQRAAIAGTLRVPRAASLMGVEDLEGGALQRAARVGPLQVPPRAASRMSVEDLEEEALQRVKKVVLQRAEKAVPNPRALDPLILLR